MVPDAATSLFSHLQDSTSDGERTPAAVTAIDLPRLAALVGCSVNELTGRLTSDSVLHASGRVAHGSEEVAFEPRSSQLPLATVETALLSVASRPSALDTAQTPKVLMHLAGEPVIGHVLTQLATAGVRRAILVLGARGSLIRAAVLAHPVSRRLEIEFVDLGESYAAGFARSLLEARERVLASPLASGRSGSFLLCTADHIFDAALVRRVAAAPLDASTDAVALVESDVAAQQGLPPTTVRVRLRESSVGRILEEDEDAGPSSPSRVSSGGGGSGGGESDVNVRRVLQIGKSVAGVADGIEAGLYLCNSEAVFAALAALSAARDYFTLAQAMAALAARGRLGAVLTEGRAWFAIETLDQLESTKTEVRATGATFDTPPSAAERRRLPFHSLPQPSTAFRS